MIVTLSQAKPPTNPPDNSAPPEPLVKNSSIRSNYIETLAITYLKCRAAGGQTPRRVPQRRNILLDSRSTVEYICVRMRKESFSSCITFIAPYLFKTVFIKNCRRKNKIINCDSARRSDSNPQPLAFLAGDRPLSYSTSCILGCVLLWWCLVVAKLLAAQAGYRWLQPLACCQEIARIVKNAPNVHDSSAKTTRAISIIFSPSRRSI